MPANLHLITYEYKFIPPFIDTVNQNFDPSSHCFILYEKRKTYQGKPYPNITKTPRPLVWFWHAAAAANQADRIFVHSLFPFAVLLLFFQPWLLKKSYWLIWGTGIYQYRERNKNWLRRFYELFRKRVIKNIGYVVTSLKGEYWLLKDWYQTKAKNVPYFFYPSVVLDFDEPETPSGSTSRDVVKVLVGNSATPSNYHREILLQLNKIDTNIEYQVYCPLAYGDQEYAQSVIKLGRKLFGNRFIPVMQFVPVGEYRQFLAEMDIAVFNHDRQQALSNIRHLIGIKKKVYLRPEITTFDHLTNLGIKVFDINQLNLNSKFPEQETNSQIIRGIYNQRQLLENLSKLFV